MRRIYLSLQNFMTGSVANAKVPSGNLGKAQYTVTSMGVRPYEKLRGIRKCGPRTSWLNPLTNWFCCCDDLSSNNSGFQGEWRLRTVQTYFQTWILLSSLNNLFMLYDLYIFCNSCTWMHKVFESITVYGCKNLKIGF